MTFDTRADEVAGSDLYSIAYAGNVSLLPSAAAVEVEALAAEVSVTTVPPLPGMEFDLGGEPFVADPEGIARISVSRAGSYELEVRPTGWSADGRRAEFSRWNTDQFGPTIVVDVPLPRSLEAGFDTFSLVGQAFVDLDNRPVGESRITSLTLRSSMGNVITAPDGQPRWQRSGRAVRRADGLESVPVRYNVDEVIVDGSNVVNAGQQRHYAEPNATWRISLLLYSANIVAHDALFGFRIGEAVEIEYPNGRARVVRQDAAGDIAVRWLARGIYRMRVADAPGWAPVTPVALSRDQDVELQGRVIRGHGGRRHGRPRLWVRPGARRPAAPHRGAWQLARLRRRGPPAGVAAPPPATPPTPPTAVHAARHVGPPADGPPGPGDALDPAT